MKELIAILLCVSMFVVHGQTVVLNEDFSAGIGSWTSVSVAGPDDVWDVVSGEAVMNGFGDTDDEDWLISPAVDMNAQHFEYFMFRYNDGFSGDLIELYYSTDFGGGGTPADVNAANWVSIPLEVLDIGNTSCVSTNFMRHPAIDVSDIVGSSVHFAFKYTGTATMAKTYKIDDVKLLADYYGSVRTFLQGGGSCAGLKTELFNTVKNQFDVVEYTSSNFDIWDALLTTDRRMNDAGTAEIVWDMFTDIPNGTGEFEFDHCSNRDNGSCPGGEGQCYNREHTFPRSWWGGTTSYTTDTINFDLHHVTPSDRAMNTAKLNYAPGNVVNASVTGSNGMKVGTNSAYSCGTKYFEPIDEFKGDYARMFLYIATRYEASIAGWQNFNAEGQCALAGNSYPAYQPWLLDVLLAWHAQDPVSQKELDRNNAVYGIQGNRNPYIDHPEWVNYIWGDELGNTCVSETPPPCSPQSTTENMSACDTYTWSTNGTTYSQSGNYTQSLISSTGCDSLVTLNLTVNQSNTGIDIVTACDAFTWIDGVTYSSNNNSATYMLVNTNNCDSLVTLNLTISQSNAGIDVQEACGSYTWIDGVTYSTSNNNATHTLQNDAGCDSVVTLNLTINQPSSGTDVVNACDTYTWIDGNNYTASNNSATHLLGNAAGCDSLVTLNLTMGYSNAGTDTQTACNDYTWVDGVTYTASNNSATYMLTNASGCDSVVTLNLTINTVDVTTSVSNFSISANATGVNYQWLDCGNNFAQIIGATSQSFTPVTDGDYAVEVNASGCADTSSCVTIAGLGFNKFEMGDVLFYPNPVHDMFTVKLISGQPFGLNVYNISGEQIMRTETSITPKKVNMNPFAQGIYLVEVIAGEEVWRTQFMLQK